MKKNAFVLVHFGNAIKYFELELYSYLMMNKNKSPDTALVYLYSSYDTPIEYVKTMEKLFDEVIPYDDNGILVNVEFNSHYKHFNTLRTCAFMYAFKLTKYNKICIFESDMLVVTSINDIFELNIPSIYFVENLIDKNVNPENVKKNVEGKQIINTETLKYDSAELSLVNGGIMLFKPSMAKFNEMIKLIPHIINLGSKYPNEELFLTVHKKVYTLPIKYNFCHYYLSVYNEKIHGNLVIVHFNESKYKYLDIVKDNYIPKFPAKKKFILFFKHEYYNKYHTFVNNILNALV